MRATDDMPAISRLLVDLNLLREVLRVLPPAWSARLGRGGALVRLTCAGEIDVTVAPHSAAESGEFEWRAQIPNVGGLARGASICVAVALALNAYAEGREDFQEHAQTWAEAVSRTVESYAIAVDVQSKRN